MPKIVVAGKRMRGGSGSTERVVDPVFAQMPQNICFDIPRRSDKSRRNRTKLRVFARVLR